MKQFAAAVILTLLVSGCSAATPQETVTLVAHDSFAISEKSIQEFEQSSGLKLEIIRAGDAGSLTNRLVLTKDAPIADLVFGIDNTFRALADENQIIDGELVPVDFADVCLNYDLTWFEEQKLSPPTSLADLTKPEFDSLTVLSSPITSSPGLAFLATTVAAFGESGYLDYWKALKENGVKITSGWEEAYFTEFSGSAGNGDYPIVLSYSSSPAAEIREDGNSQTAAILKDCFRQTEYIGVLKNAVNPTGAKKLQEFLLSTSFQNTVAELMYVYPIDSEATIPEEWKKFGKPAETTIGAELDIANSRERWQRSWLEIFG